MLSTKCHTNYTLLSVRVLLWLYVYLVLFLRYHLLFMSSCLIVFQLEYKNNKIIK